VIKLVDSFDASFGYVANEGATFYFKVPVVVLFVNFQTHFGVHHCCKKGASQRLSNIVGSCSIVE
jgi:hypothetical protein